MASRHVSTCSSLRAGDVPLLGKAVFVDVTELRVRKWHRSGPSTGPESNDRHPDKRRPEERTDTREPGGRGRSAEAASRARGSHQERWEAGRASRGLRRRPNARTADPCPPEQMLNFCGHLRPAPGSAGTFRLSASSAPQGTTGGSTPTTSQAPCLPVLAGFGWDGGGGTVKWGAFWAAPMGSRGVARPLPLLVLLALLRLSGLEVRSAPHGQPRTHPGAPRPGRLVRRVFITRLSSPHPSRGPCLARASLG